ncbi:MAG: hypothetical protein E7631_00855 [Ruminococcaceae bacterium]|nr:hypothetical protein [Oscillospiraceae bacterium]
MKAEMLCDAMEYIDEDMLAEVDSLRMRRISGRHWIRWASLAASVCIIAGGVFVWSRMYGLTGETEGAGLPETGAEVTEDQEMIRETAAAETEAAPDGGLTESIAGVPAGLDCSSLDVSRTKAVRLGSGITGEVVWLTDPADIQAVTDCVLQIRAENPESSRGYYGWSYDIALYDVEEPTEDTEPFWGGAMCYGSFGSMYLYETVSGHQYYARYEMTGVTTEEVDAVCEQFFPPLSE